MIFRDRHGRFGQSLERAAAVEPGGSDEAVERPPDHVFDQRASFADAVGGVTARQTKKFAFPGGHQACLQPTGGAPMTCVVAVEVAVQEHLDATVSPAAQPRGEGGARDDRRVTPMVRHNQHCEPLADMRLNKRQQLVDLAFETRRYIVDGGQQQAAARGRHGWAVADPGRAIP